MDNGGTPISYNSLDMQTDNIITEGIRHENLPTKDAPVYPHAHANRSSIPLINWPQKLITVTGKVVEDGIADLDGFLDDFRAAFAGKDGNLDIGYDGGTRRYIATATSVDIDRPGGLSWASFTIQFLCTQPFGQSTTATTAANETGISTATDDFSHTFVGSAPWQLPVITITIQDVTGGDGHIMITNDANGQGLLIEGPTFADNDVVVIDSKNRTVTLNGDPLDYIGTFPEWAPGAGQINYADGFTTRDVDVLVQYYPLYL